MKASFLRDPPGLVIIYLHRSYKHSIITRLTFPFFLFDHKTLPTCTPEQATRSYHCLIPENPPLLHGGHFCLRPLNDPPPPPLEFSVSIIPQNCLEIRLLSLLAGYPLKRIFRQKMKAVVLYFYKNYICFCNKLRKISLFILIQCLIAV